MSAPNRTAPPAMSRRSRVIAALTANGISFLCLMLVLLSGTGQSQGGPGWLSFAVVSRCHNHECEHRVSKTKNTHRSTAQMSRLKSETNHSGASLMRTTSLGIRTFMHSTSGPTAVAMFPSKALTTRLIFVLHPALNLFIICTGTGHYGVHRYTKTGQGSSG